MTYNQFFMAEILFAGVAINQNMQLALYTLNWGGYLLFVGMHFQPKIGVKAAGQGGQGA